MIQKTPLLLNEIKAFLLLLNNIKLRGNYNIYDIQLL